MKRATFLLFFLGLGCLSLYAQRYAVLNSDYIMKQLPVYKSAQEQLEKSAKKWTNELATMREDIRKMKINFEAEKVLLSEGLKKKRLALIASREKEYNTLNDKYFGEKGELYKKTKSLLKPIQDEIINAVKGIAAKEGYAMVFDKAGSTTIIFADPKYDISDQVLQNLGY